MSAPEAEAASQPNVHVSLILPIYPGQTISAQQFLDYRRALGANGSDNDRPVEVVVATAHQGADGWCDGDLQAKLGEAQSRTLIKVSGVNGNGAGWASLVRSALNVSSGEHLVVIDLRRGYSPDSLARVAARLPAKDCDLAVGVPRLEDIGLFAWLRLRFGFGLVSRLLLGTSDIFSGLFAVRRSLWEREAPHTSSGDSSLILDLLSRNRARCVDVTVSGGRGFKPRGVGVGHIRPLKRLLDLRFGNYSRLAQFCMVGASGMVVDLSCYALFQLLFSFTRLYTLPSVAFGVSWHVAAARALAIAIALVWNFAFNRRLTFNDARESGLARQFLKYVFSNALAIAFNFSVSLYLPGKVAFFARHKLAAAVVAIVAATGISFSMSRWIVFARRS